jgi:hypothetical protein
VKSALEINKLTGKPGWIAFSGGQIVAQATCPLEGKWKVVIMGAPVVDEEFDSAPAANAFIRGWFMGKEFALADGP